MTATAIHTNKVKHIHALPEVSIAFREALEAYADHLRYTQTHDDKTPDQIVGAELDARYRLIAAILDAAN